MHNARKSAQRGWVCCISKSVCLFVCPSQKQTVKFEEKKKAGTKFCYIQGPPTTHAAWRPSFAQAAAPGQGGCFGAAPPSTSNTSIKTSCCTACKKHTTRDASRPCESKYGNMRRRPNARRFEPWWIEVRQHDASTRSAGKFTYFTTHTNSAQREKLLHRRRRAQRATLRTLVHPSSET